MKSYIKYIIFPLLVTATFFGAKRVGGGWKATSTYIVESIHLSPIHAITNNRHTMKLKDAPIGASIQIGSKTFVKIADNQYMQKAPICHTRVWDFDYTGSEQIFSAPVDGTYKLEVWGAQGGDWNNEDKIFAKSGYGGYAVGTITLKQDEKLYVFVAQKGLSVSSGFDFVQDYVAYPNGGSVRSGTDAISNTSYNIYYNGGGGSTHIATENKLIKDLPPDSSNLLIVAGGGGGIANWWNISADAGSGGGYIGVGTDGNFDNVDTTGGTQNSPGLGGGNTDGHSREGEWLAGAYGVGGGILTYNPEKVNVSGAGGGGYYGGGASWGGPGAGGSGYIGNSLLSDKHMTCYNCTTSNEEATRTQSNTCVNDNPTADCSKIGHGHARITLLAASDESCYIPECPSGTAYSAKYGDCKPLASFTEIAQVTDFAYTGGEQTFTVPTDGIYKLEVWGAQGGNYDDDTKHAGGYGGYSVGIATVPRNSTLYVNVGGMGLGGKDTIFAGGYNGGGTGSSGLDSNGGSSGRSLTSGGGATHIATVAGQLQNLSAYKNTAGTNISKEILIVAGGGAGGNNTGYDNDEGGANGGGYLGQAHTLYQCSPGGGSQTSGGSGGNPYNCANDNLTGMFGKGGGGTNGTYLGEISGGGGGWYGGGGSYYAAGGGGSGYIGSSNLISVNSVVKHMTCYNCVTSDETNTRTQSNTCASAAADADCAKIGHGFARITRLEVPANDCGLHATLTGTNTCTCASGYYADSNGSTTTGMGGSCLYQKCGSNTTSEYAIACTCSDGYYANNEGTSTIAAAGASCVTCPTDTVYNPAVNRCIATTMQAFTSAMCDAFATPTGSNYTTVGSLKDTRNNVSYIIRKFSDGKCWMTNNLAYGNVSSATDFPTYSYTNKTTSGILGSGLYGVAASPGSGYEGYLYNWQAVMQRSDAYYGLAYAGPTGVQGICPTGWHVPTGGRSGELQALSDATSTNASFFFGGNFCAAGSSCVAGDIDGNFGSLLDQGSYLYVWSSTPASATATANSGYLYASSSKVSSASYYYRCFGFSVRCVKD